MVIFVSGQLIIRLTAHLRPVGCGGFGGSDKNPHSVVLVKGPLGFSLVVVIAF